MGLLPELRDIFNQQMLGEIKAKLAIPTYCIQIWFLTEIYEKTCSLYGHVVSFQSTLQSNGRHLKTASNETKGDSHVYCSIAQWLNADLKLPEWMLHSHFATQIKY